MPSVETFASQLDPASSLPTQLQDAIDTGGEYYSKFKAATQGVTLGPHGSVQISDKAATAIADTITAVVVAAVPVLGPALAIFLAIAPSAGAGPGTCASDPPNVRDAKHPTPSELRAWSHFTAWEAFFEPFAPGAARSFEAFANPILAWNWELGANCFGNLSVPAPLLLAALISAWNGSHAGPSRTITRGGLNPSAAWGLPPGYDPIANALEGAVYGRATGSVAAPQDVTSSFVVQAGAEHAPAPAPAPTPTKTIAFKLSAPAPAPVKSVALHLAQAAPPAATPAAAGTKVKIALGGVLVAALALAAKFL